MYAKLEKPKILTGVYCPTNSNLPLINFDTLIVQFSAQDNLLPTSIYYYL